MLINRLNHSIKKKKNTKLKYPENAIYESNLSWVYLALHQIRITLTFHFLNIFGLFIVLILGL